MGCILLFKNPEDELEYLELKRQERVKRIHLIRKLLICLKEEDFELYRHFIANHKTFKRLLKSSIQHYINRWLAFKRIQKLWNIF